MWLPISSSLTFATWHQYSGEPQKVKEDREIDVPEVSAAGACWQRVQRPETFEPVGVKPAATSMAFQCACDKSFI